MTAILPVLFISALQFVEQDLPDLDVGSADFYTLFPARFRQADLDGEGHTDLIMPDKVFLQKDGQFDTAGAVPLPTRNNQSSCDIWGQHLYLWSPEQLTVTKLDGGKWRTVLVQDLKRPEPDSRQYPMPERPSVPQNAARASDQPPGGGLLYFDRFLQDVDGDGAPEIAAPSRSGLVLYKKSGDKFQISNVLDFFPRLSVSRMPDQPLWPETARRVDIPSRSMSCQYVLEGNRLTVISREDCAKEKVQYRIRRYRIDADAQGGFVVGDVREETSEPLHLCMQPMKLNGDERMDYAGGDWRLVNETLMPMPLSEVMVSTDGGKTVQTVRSAAFGPVQAFVDFDGDGDMDLVAESTGLYAGGARESLMRFLTSRQIPHEIQIHLQDARGNFSKSADYDKRLTIGMDVPPVQGSLRLHKYQRGALMNLKGDFDGDGRRDLVVSDTPSRLSVYLNNGAGFSKSPDATVPVGHNADFDVVDLDGDGCSDIAAGWSMQDGSRRGKIYLSRKGGS